MLTLIALALAAPAFEDLDQLDRRVQVFAADAQVTPIDRRLRLKACPEAAEMDRAPAHVVVRCPALGWKLSVPLLGAGGTAAPLFIRRNDPVAVTVNGVGFVMTTTGVALEDGVEKATVRVKMSTGQLLAARAVGVGEVTVD
jgi:hypothetical protein